jgi:hypothetical protein
VEAIQKNHQNHRELALKNIEQQQSRRRSSLKLRVLARVKKQEEGHDTLNGVVLPGNETALVAAEKVLTKDNVAMPDVLQKQTATKLLQEQENKNKRENKRENKNKKVNKNIEKSKNIEPEAAMQKSKKSSAGAGGVESNSSDMIKKKLRKMGRTIVETIATKLQKKGGSLSRKNLAVMFKKLGMKDQDVIEHCFKEMAKDGSNKISHEEFCDWVFGGKNTPKEPTLEYPETVVETHEVHTDPATGKRYSINTQTGKSTWVVQNHTDEKSVNHTTGSL